MGGPHVGAHRDHNRIVAFLRGKVRDSVVDDLDRIFTQGIPAFCNAEATEANFLAYFRYGNHKTVLADPDKTYKTLVKDHKRGNVIVFDQRLIPFVLNGHLTPQGVVDLDKIYKSPRPIFDSSFRAQDWNMAINDWTSKLTEQPPLSTEIAEVSLMEEIWNFRISYPWQELYVGDNNGTNAFRQLKYSSLLLGMRCTDN